MALMLYHSKQVMVVLSSVVQIHNETDTRRVGIPRVPCTEALAIESRFCMSRHSQFLLYTLLSGTL